MRVVVHHVGILLAASAMLALSCNKRVEVTCKWNEGFDPVTGECFKCPEGTKANTSTAKCEPYVVKDGDSPADELVHDVAPEPTDAPNLEEVVDRKDGPDTSRGGDVMPDALKGTGEIGASCNMDADCLDGLACFDWPGGYCIQPDCQTDVDCPADGFCLPLLENGQACFAGCDQDSDCRGGYGCKAVPTLIGVPKQVCHPIGAESKVLGAQCVEHDECDGSLACVSLGPAGMCTVSGCSSFDPCPPNSECIIWGIMTLCLPTCDTPEQCAANASELFTCQEMEDVFEEDVMVCSPIKQGLGIGELCFFSTECNTGYCHLLVSGKCSGMDNHECGSDGECAEGLCITDASVQKGVCSRPCGPGDGCTGGTYCVLTESGPFCMSACDNYSEPCGPAGFNMFCTYGKLYYPAAPSGKYACVKGLAGDASGPCKDAADCLSGICYGADQLDMGYCATTCVTDGECPFGTLCQLDTLAPGQTFCTRVCFSDLDCPAGLSCKNTFYSEKACVL